MRLNTRRLRQQKKPQRQSEAAEEAATKCIAVAQIVEGISSAREQVLRAEATALFEQADRNHDGSLSHSELKKQIQKDDALRERLSITKWKTFFSEIDSDGDGVVTLEEFAKYYALHCSEGAGVEEVAAVCSKGTPSAALVAAAAQEAADGVPLETAAAKAAEDALDEAVSKEESDRFFDLYDTDASGTVDMEELLEMVAAFKQRDSSSLNQAKIKEAWDADGDGTVSLLAAM